MSSAPDYALAAAGLVHRAGGEIESVIRGRSMGRTLPAGARVRIADPSARGFPEGMVVAFLARDVLVGHRVVGRTRDRQGRETLLTRGDGSLMCDPPVDPALVVGEVVARWSGAGWESLPPAPRRGWPGALLAALILGGVRTLATLDGPRSSRVLEGLIGLGRRACSLLAGRIRRR